ncbi:hypothetical protein KXW47_004866 [Aspergillus fumigatus]|nr:hypothetical protein KXW47_004866 [Aspergillus fumigatus]
MHTLLPNGTIITFASPFHSFGLSSSANFAVTDLETIDLSKSWQNSDPGLFNYIAKPWNASDPADYPPYLNEGASFSNGESLFFYGGYSSGWGGPPIPPLATWKYDIANNNWTRDGFWGVPLVRLTQGGAVQSSVDKKAYYLSGTLNPAGNPVFYGTPGADTYMTPGLITLDMNTLEWTNASTTDMDTFGTIGDGYMSLIESVGDQGLIVAFGGYTYPVGEKISFLAARQNETTHRNSMEFVRVYDIANRKWYTQQTTGDIPRWRMAGCTVVVASDDLSSYSIYVFGGMGQTTAESDGDVYVLSLPSFQWIRVYRDNTIRYKHKCQLVQKHTMLVIGGIIPIDGMEYYPQSRNCDTATFANGIGIFDLQTLSWRTNYNATDVVGYAVPSQISDVIGGGPTGDATLTEPKNGFNSTQLASLFTKRSVRATSTAVSPSTSATSTSTATSTRPRAAAPSLSGGTIAGVIVGSVAGAAAIGALAFYLLVLRRRRKAKLTKQSIPSWADLPAGKPKKPPQVDPTELQGEHYPAAFELMGDGEFPRAELPAEANCL